MGRERALDYGDVLEYLSHRAGEDVTLSSYPTFHYDTEAGEWGEEGTTILGLTVEAALGDVEAVKEYESTEWLDGRAGARIKLWDSAGEQAGALVLTREWFAAAALDEAGSGLRVFVRANTAAKPYHPPVGQEPDDDRSSPAALHDLVGWGFAFEFVSPPWRGPWAADDARGGEGGPRND